MKMIGKIILFILLIVSLILIIIIGLIGYTIYQAYSLAQEIKSLDLNSDLNAIKQGDCSKLQSLESKSSVLIGKAKSSCSNPLIKKYLKNADFDICGSLQNVENLNSMISNLNQTCYSIKEKTQ